MKKIIVSLLVLLCGTLTYAQSEAMRASAEKLSRALFYVYNSYVDTVNFEKVVDETLQDLMTRLDPHSNYIPKDKVQDTDEELAASFEGVGIEFAIINDTLTVQASIVGGPCEAVGVLAGDKIVSIDGENVAGIGIDNDGVRKRLRGPKGTKVALDIKRGGQDRTFVVTRDKIPLNSIDAAYMVEPGVLYLKLSRFAQSTLAEFLDIMDGYDGKFDNLILDLRGNGGGFMHVAVALADAFLDKGQKIVSMEGRSVRETTQYANGVGFLSDKHTVVLVDGSSASSSEILAGALQDWDKAVVIGRRTFGKGLVQREFPLADGSKLRLTIARYHTPSGRVVQSPYEEGHRDEYYSKAYDRYEKGEAFSRDSIHFADSLKFKTLKLGRTVYGGGGIMPDIFIPSDTTGYNQYFINVVGHGYLTEYATDFADKHRALIKTAMDIDEYNEIFAGLEDEALNGLVAYCLEKGVKADDDKIEVCRGLLCTRMKAICSRAAFGLEGYYRIINREEDPDFQKALEVLHGWTGEYPDVFKQQ